MPKDTFNNLDENKQQKIIDAIIDEMSRVTYEHINISNIVRQAEIPRGSFYQYFTDKKDLYEFMFTYIAKEKMNYFKSLFMKQDLPFLELYKALYRLGVEFSSNHPKLFLVGKKMLESPYYYQNETTKKAFIESKAMFVELIKKDQEQHLIRKDVDPEVLSSLLIDYMSNYSITEILKDDFNVQIIIHRVDKIIDIIQKGIDVHV